MDENVQYWKGEILSKWGYESREISIKTQNYYFWETWQNVEEKLRIFRKA